MAPRELNLLGEVDADEVSPVFRGANRKGVVLKGDAMDADAVNEQVRDILAIPWEHEGAMVDQLRKGGADEVVIKSAVTSMRLLHGIADELPEGLGEPIEKLGREMYARENPKLNSGPGPHMSGELDATEGNDDDLDGSAAGAPKNGRSRDGELIGRGDPAPKVSADADDDMDDDGVMKDGKEPYGDVTYADPGYQADKKKRYPLDTETHIRAAWSYVNMPKNAAKYSSGDLATVKGRIKAAMKRIGADVSKEQEEAASMLDRALEAVHKAFRPKRKSQDQRSTPADEDGDDSEPDDDPDDTDVNKEGGTMAGDATVAVPIKKEDGGWDLSGVPEEARPFYTDMIEKADKTAKELEEAKERIAKQDEELQERTVVAKADELKFVAPTDDLTAVLKSAKATMSPEDFEKLETVLKSANGRIEQSSLFKEFGRSSGDAGESAGDAWAQIEKAATDLVEKSGDQPITKEQAIDRFLNTAEGARLYSVYLSENPLVSGGVS